MERNIGGNYVLSKVAWNEPKFSIGANEYVHRNQSESFNVFLCVFFQHYTEHKQKTLLTTNSNSVSTQALPTSTTSTNSIFSSNLLFPQAHYHHLQAVSQIPMPPPAYLYTSSTLTSPSSSILHVRNEIRLNKRGYREQFDGIAHWRPLCVYEQCSKRAKKLSYCKRHYTEQMNKNSMNTSQNETDNNTNQSN